MPHHPMEPTIEGAQSEPSPGDDPLEELRKLLIGPEKQQLVIIRERIENPKLRAQDVGDVLVEAIRSQQKNKATEFDDALIPTVESGLKTSVRKDPHTLANALYPVMGPAIRRSIYESIRSLIESFNEALSQGLSIRGIKWRIEAVRTGRPFAEVVLLHTIVFRVEQIFLIHKKTGLLLQHLAAPSVGMLDPERISGMLSAIQEFVRDSFHASQMESLNTMQVGDLQVWVEQGPEAILAAVVRGHPPQRLHFKLKSRLEQVHQQFGLAFDAFDGEADPFQPASELLADCLESQFDEGRTSRPRAYAAGAITIFVILCMVWVVTAIVQKQRWAEFIDRLNSEPGIVVLSSERAKGRYLVRGLRDPLASDPTRFLQVSGFAQADVQFQWRPYQALDAPIVLKRLQEYLQPPPTVSLSFDSGTLHLKGEAPRAWIEIAQQRGLLIPGVTGLNSKGLISSERGDLNRSRQMVDSSMILFPVGISTITPDQQKELETITRQTKAFITQAEQNGEPFIIELTGRSDRSGSEAENLLLSQERARRIVRELRQRGIAGRYLRWRGLGSTDPLSDESDEVSRQRNRSVTFKPVSVESQAR